MKMLAAIILLASVHFHKGNVSQIRPDTDYTYANIMVFDCKSRWIDLYADKKMTIHLANPIITDSDGDFTYYDKNSEETVIINFKGEGSSGFASLDTCPTKETK